MPSLPEARFAALRWLQLILPPSLLCTSLLEWLPGNSRSQAAIAQITVARPSFSALKFPNHILSCNALRLDNACIHALPEQAKSLYLLGEHALARQVAVRVKANWQRAPKVDSKLRHYLRLTATQDAQELAKEQEAARQEDAEKAKTTATQKLADTELKLSRARERDNAHTTKRAHLEAQGARLKRELAARESELLGFYSQGASAAGPPEA